MEWKALDKSIAMEPVTFLESRARRQSSTILTSAVQHECPRRNPDILDETKGWNTVIQLVKHNFF